MLPGLLQTSRVYIQYGAYQSFGSIRAARCGLVNGLLF